MTEVLRTDDQLDGIIKAHWYELEQWYDARRHLDTRGDTTSLLHRQLYQATTLLSRIDAGEEVLPREDLNPICELTTQLYTPGRILSTTDEALRDSVGSLILDRMDRYMTPENRQPYKLLLWSMGGEEPNQKAIDTKNVQEKPEPPHEPVSLIQYREERVTPQDRKGKISWNAKSVRSTAMVAATAATISLLPQTAAAAKPPESTPSAHTTGVQRALQTTLTTPTSETELLPTAPVNVKPRVVQLPNAPAHDPDINVVPVVSPTTPESPTPETTTVSLLPTGSVTETVSGSGSAELPPVESVDVGVSTTFRSNQGQAEVVNIAPQLTEIVNTPQFNEHIPTIEAPSVITIATTGNANSDVLSVPAPEAPQVTMATQNAALSFIAENGTAADAVQQEVQVLAARGQLSPLPSSPFQDKINQILLADNTLNSTPAAQNSLAFASIVAKLPPMYTQLGSASETDLSTVESTIYSWLSDPEHGLASLGGAEQLSPEALHAVLAALAKYQANTMTIREKADMMQQMNGADITFTTPEVHEPKPHQPAPHHGKPHQPKHRQHHVPHEGQGTHHEQHSGHDKHGSLLHLSQRELAMQTAETWIQQGGTHERQGHMMLYFLKNTQWTVNFILGGPIANGMHESEGLNPMRSQATQTDVPAARVIAQGLFGGWGYWQSDPASKVIEWCYAHGLDPDTVEGQGAWLISSVRSNAELSAVAHDENTSVQHATVAFEQLFERAGVPAMESRLRYAVDAASHFLPRLLGLLQTQQQQRAAAREAQKEARQAAKAQRKEEKQQAKLSHTPFSEYILGVPKDGEGHAVPYINQVSDLNGVDGINGYDACGLTSLYTIEQALKKNPQTAATLHQGLMNANAYSDSAGILNTDNLIGYIRGNLNLNVDTILYERSGATTDDVMSQVRGALDQGKILLVHTSSLVSAREGGATTGHFLVMYGYNDNGYFVANVGNRADSPPQGYALDRETVKSWLDGFYAVSN